jgi:hypothetical protein
MVGLGTLQASRLQLPSLAGDESSALPFSWRHGRARVRVGVRLYNLAASIHVPSCHHLPAQFVAGILTSVFWNLLGEIVVFPTRVSACGQALRLRQDVLPLKKHLRHGQEVDMHLARPLGTYAPVMACNSSDSSDAVPTRPSRYFKTISASPYCREVWAVFFQMAHVARALSASLAEMPLYLAGSPPSSTLTPCAPRASPRVSKA